MGKSTLNETSPISLEFINRLEDVYLFHLTGGEPFLVPNFVDICTKLSAKKQYLSLNTNLTHRVDNFITQVDPDSVIYINCSIHYWLRKDHMRPFLRHYNQLKNAGFFVFATIVMIPEQFDEIKTFWNEYADEIELFPKLMRGISKGEPYPHSYTDIQRKEISEMTQKASQRLHAMDPQRFEMLCTHSISIDDWRSGEIPEAANPCIDGKHFMRITEKGDLIFCQDKVIGNIHRNGLDSLSDLSQTCSRQIVQHHKIGCNL